ncbi:MAG: alpha/beta fold hydrolase [Rhizobiaceae bacterium]|jgi:pyruvate dehydrogenase E2 component (dihydrolipoamide acetyltransferase)|nr:alpha/beta fold hydrolase [Rhizobiaceae bacterium]
MLGRITLPQARLGGGEEGGPHIVLLHGFGGSATQWRPLMTQLAGAGASVTAFDLPGHGASLPQGAQDARRCAEAVLQALAAAEPFHLAGHSFGGAVAALMAINAPEKVASLTLLSPGGFGPEIAATDLRAFGAATSDGELAGALRTFCAPGFSWPPEALAAMAAERARPGQSTALARLADLILKADGTQGTLPLARLAALQLPVTLVWGRADRILPVHHAELFPAARRVLLDGVGHMLHAEAPDAVFEAITRQAGV